MSITTNRITPCLWFDGQAQQAAEHYTSIFPNARMGAVTHYTKAGQEVHGHQAGSVLTIEFALDGQSEYGDVKVDAERLMQSAVEEGNWREKCKGRDLLRALCSKHGIKYEHFRNALIDRLEIPPDGLKKVMNRIISA